MEREPLIYDLSDKENISDMHIDSNGDVVIPVKNGDRVVLSPSVAEEVWRLLEKEHAVEVIRARMNLEEDECLVENLDWLANTYTDTKEDLISPLESFICEMVLREFDLQLMEEE